MCRRLPGERRQHRDLDFGADIKCDYLVLAARQITLAWCVLGVAGSFGAAIGFLTHRFWIGPVHRLAVFAMAFALIRLAAANLAPGTVFAVMGLVGFAYIVSSGAFLLWGIAMFPDRPNVGLGLPFLILDLGQTVGAPLFGALLERAGSSDAAGLRRDHGSASIRAPDAASTR